MRTSNPEYIEAWQERQIDVDFMVSSELETAHAVSSTIGVPAAKQTDVFADGQVQIVEFDVPLTTPGGGAYGEVVGLELKAAKVPKDSKVASIIRGDRVLVPRGDESILPGDRIIVIGSPDAAREWSRSDGERPAARGRRRHLRGRRDRTGHRPGPPRPADPRSPVEPDEERAREVAEVLPHARVYCATGVDPDFIERERIGQARAAIFAMREDAKNLYAATLAQRARRSASRSRSCTSPPPPRSSSGPASTSP